MTPLERALRDRILAKGSISLEAYMEACNDYYYATRDPLGASGDFTTAPEISQMFGEIIGAALADCWMRAGCPKNAVYAELGPGRGTLSSDALRVLKAAGFRGDVHMIETSPVLRQAQHEKVPNAAWHDSIDDLPAGPLLLVANEFLDALPIRQHVAGIERQVIVAAGGLAFDRDGEVIETSPARDHAVRTVADRCVASGGVAIFIDYGHERSAAGDTLQAVRKHRFAPVLAQPGEQDLTSHVDFEALTMAARSAGAEVTPLVCQGDWLLRLGIKARAEALTRANPGRRDALQSAVDRLTSREEMGKLFKVIAVHSRGWPAPQGLP
ncbi:MAG TPA: SAM-dependent methyltransferase [Sphingomicrobium sp.]|nr:SAM-dependent methyltransferase [Sphingomicrobium sp.]